MDTRYVPPRRDGRVIIHFDYDCFYASVFEAKNPALKSLPFAVQQKQIIVTCNYEARRRGLSKLQLITEAKKICPDLIIELGEDISPFRDASKELYNFIKQFSWNGRVERLGFDEVWMDTTDMVDYNMETINRRDLANSFFQLSRDDPTYGFAFDASNIAGHAYPKDYMYDGDIEGDVDNLLLRLRLGSHLACHIRHQLEQQKGYTSTVGISTSKLLSKLVGNLNKPKGQTTVMPPYDSIEGERSNVLKFIDDHEIGKIPGIGFKLAQKLREVILGRPATFDKGLVYGGKPEPVKVSECRTHPETNPEQLEKLLTGPGSPHGIGYKIWCLLHGLDDTEVGLAKVVPSQISIEDSYIRLDTMSEVLRELTALATSLLTRMHIDLLAEEDEPRAEAAGDDGPSHPPPTTTPSKRWLAHPKTLRLSTRPRQPLQPDGSRVRSFKRISHSAPLPTFVFALSDSVEALAERLVRDALVPMFRRLHPEKAGWNLSLVNVAVTNMAETAGESRTANGRNIGTMFRRQEDVLREFRVTDFSPLPGGGSREGSGDDVVDSWDVSAGIEGEDEEGGWDDDGGLDGEMEFCDICGSHIPTFAMVAHRRFHSPGIQ